MPAGRPKGSKKTVAAEPEKVETRGGNHAHDGDISIHKKDARLTTPLGHSKEITSPNFKVTPATEFRVIEVAKMICDGKSRASCLNYIQESQGVSLYQAKYYYQAALKWLIPSDLDEYKKGLLQANIERLEKIIEDGIENRKDSRRGADYLRTAKDAISELNKMLGVGNPRLQIAQENKDGEQQIISIDFN